MKKVGAFALVLILSGCATATKQTPVVETERCDRAAAYERGKMDASGERAMDGNFIRSCGKEGRAGILQAYKEGYESIQKSQESDVAKKVISDELQTRQAAPTTWVCEIEANSKVFTGMGATRVEASNSAKTVCGNYFDASLCQASECKRE